MLKRRYIGPNVPTVVHVPGHGKVTFADRSPVEVTADQAEALDRTPSEFATPGAKPRKSAAKKKAAPRKRAARKKRAAAEQAAAPTTTTTTTADSAATSEED